MQDGSVTLSSDDPVSAPVAAETQAAVQAILCHVSELIAADDYEQAKTLLNSDRLQGIHSVLMQNSDWPGGFLWVGDLLWQLDEFDKAVSFARQPQALARIRSGLRPAMLRSPLCNAQLYAREVAGALRHRWYRWCRGPGVRVDIPEPSGLFREGRCPSVAMDAV